MKLELKAALEHILNLLKLPALQVVIELPKNPNFGDFSSNIAMKLSREVKSEPIEIAENIKESLTLEYPNLIESIDVVRPGFLNINVNKKYICSKIETIIKSGDLFGYSKYGKGKRALVEFVSANPTGPLTVGHGRGAILGDVISNILKWNGYSVEREYYYNNAGRQMEKLGLSVQARYLELLGDKIDFPEDGYEGTYIKNIAQEVFNEFGDQLRDSNDLLLFIEIAEEYIFSIIKQTLKKLDIKFNNYFNEKSLFQDGSIDQIVEILSDKNLIYKKDGATWFKASAIGKEQDRVIIKSTGEPTYRLPDIAYHRNKLERGYDLIIDVLGADHMDAFPDVLAAVEQMDYPINKIKVLIHQFVTLIKEGKPVKMSTRKAQFVTLDNLIEDVGIDVVRYFFLMRGMNSHLNFDLDLARDESDENPVYYLQYANARLSNILKNAIELGYDLNLNKTDFTLLSIDLEIDIIKTLLDFPFIIEKILDSLEPQGLAIYLNNLAGKFHRYYAKERVLTNNNDLTAARLQLIRSIQIVIKNGLKILNISAPDRM